MIDIIVSIMMSQLVIQSWQRFCSLARRFIESEICIHHFLKSTRNQECQQFELSDEFCSLHVFQVSQDGTSALKAE